MRAHIYAHAQKNLPSHKQIEAQTKTDNHSYSTGFNVCLINSHFRVENTAIVIITVLY